MDTINFKCNHTHGFEIKFIAAYLVILPAFVEKLVLFDDSYLIIKRCSYLNKFVPRVNTTVDCKALSIHYEVGVHKVRNKYSC